MKVVNDMNLINRRIIKLFPMCVIIILTMCFFAACNKSNLENSHIQLSSLKTDGIFQYTDAKWGVSPDEANKTLANQIVKDEARIPSDGSYITYKMEKQLEINGYDVFATFEFADNKLRQIMFSVYSEKDDYKKCFDTLSDELKKLYGDGKDVLGVTENRNIFWLLENTKLDISEVTITSDPFVLISIGDMSQFPAISIDDLYDIFNQEGVYEVEPAENNAE